MAKTLKDYEMALDRAVEGLVRKDRPGDREWARYDKARDAFRDAAMRHHATMPSEAADAQR
jgi:hypothetical protein